MTVRGRVNPTAAIAVSVAVLLSCSVILTILLAVAVWPGEAKLAAHVLCPADQPDAYVVADSYSSSPARRQRPQDVVQRPSWHCPAYRLTRLPPIFFWSSRSSIAYPPAYLGMA